VDCAIDGLLVDRKRDHGGAMSLSKSIENLQMLLEAPLPPDFDPNVLRPENQKNAWGEYYYSALDRPAMQKISKMSSSDRALYGLDVLASGSGRVVLTLRVSASDFTADGQKVLRDYGIDNLGTVKTVIKLATNPNGVAQNSSEIRAWEDTKSRLFVPVLDHSALNNREASVAVDGDPVPPQYSNWIQTLEAAPFKTEKEWRDALEEFFGIPIHIFLYFIGNATNSEIDKKVQGWIGVYDLSKDQRDNLKELVRATSVGELVLSDLSSRDQWGKIGDRLFILDYGFDIATSQAYKSASALQIDASISNDGVLMLKFKGSRKDVALAKQKLRPF
jgi:hypothetical protein